MRKLIAVGATLLVLVGALLVAPRFVDPAAYRDILIAEMHRAIGRDIEIAGPLTFALLPTPHLTAADIRVDAADTKRRNGGKSEMLHAAWLEARLAPLPLLAGRIVLRNVTLIDPVLDLSGENAAGGDWRQSIASDGLAIDTLQIVNGTVLYRAGAASERVDTIALELKRGPTGALHATGSFRSRGLAPSFSLALDRSDGPGGFALALTLARPAGRIELSGETARTADGSYSLDASVKATSEDLAAVLTRSGLSQWSPGHRLEGTAHVKADAGQIRLDDLTLALDDARGDGSLVLPLAGTHGVDLSLRFNRLDLDRLVGAATIDPSTAMSPPPWLRVKLDLAAAALGWRGGVIRDARLQASAAEGAVAIERLAGILPGNSAVTLDGQLAVANGQPEFRGTLDTGTDNLRELLRWLGVDATSIPADRLRKATLTSRFTTHPDRVDIGDLDLTVDASRLTGAATLALRQRLAVGARLSIDQLNLDAYLPSAATGTALLAGFDANVDATIATLTWHGQPARGLHAAAILQNGELTLREASIAELADASATASGLVTGIGSKDLAWRATVSAKGTELSHVIRLIDPEIAFAWRLGGAFSVSGDLASDAGATAIDLGVTALGGTLHLSGEIGGSDAPDLDIAFEASHPSLSRLARTLGIAYQPAGGDPGAVTAAGKLRRAPAKLSLDDLAVSLGALTVGGAADLDLATARPKLGATLVFGDLAIDRFLPARQTALLDLPSFIRLAAAGTAPASGWSTTPIDLTSLGLVDADFALRGDRLSYGAAAIAQPQAMLTLRDDTLEIGGLSGTIFGGALTGKASLASVGNRAAAKLALQGADLNSLLGAAIGATPLAGRGDLDLSVATQGGSLAELVGGLNGTARLTSNGGTLSGIDLQALTARLDGTGPTDIFALTRGLSAGKTPYQSLGGSFRITDGIVLSDDFALVAGHATARARIAIDLPGWSVQSRIEFHLTDHGDVPPFALTLDGSIDAPRKVFDINAIEAYLTHRGTTASP
ncbi:MAG: hypothetical protein JWL84_703 [Rhodospirillales bacterium]|nr:hypothetical protein [Rhodospirillales bacterium]